MQPWQRMTMNSEPMSCEMIQFCYHELHKIIHIGWVLSVASWFSLAVVCPWPWPWESRPWPWPGLTLNITEWLWPWPWGSRPCPWPWPFLEQNWVALTLALVIQALWLVALLTSLTAIAISADKCCVLNIGNAKIHTINLNIDKRALDLLQVVFARDLAIVIV